MVTRCCCYLPYLFMVKMGESYTKMLKNLRETGLIQLLCNRNFRLVWFANLTSAVGNILHEVAIVWLVSKQTESAFAVGAVVISSSLPFLIFGLVGGAIADRFNKRKIMIISDLLRALLVLLVPVLFSANLLTLPAIMVIAFLRSAIAKFFYPAQQSLIPYLVDKEQLASANSFNQTSRMAVSAAAPAIGGILIAMTGLTAAFVIDAITFLVSAICLYGITTAVSEETTSQTKKDFSARVLAYDIFDGIRYIYHSRALRIVVFTTLVSVFGFGPYRPITLLYFQNYIGMDSAQYGLNLSMAFIGLAVGSAFAGTKLKGFHPERVYAFGLFIMALTTLFIGLTQGLFAIYGVSFFRAFGNGLIVVALTTMLQLRASEKQLGRVFSTVDVCSESVRPLSIAAATTLADAVSPQFAILLSSGFFWLSALIASLMLKPKSLQVDVEILSTD